jgi:hypothetical protein
MAQSPPTTFTFEPMAICWAFVPLLFTAWTGWSALEGSLVSRYSVQARSLASAWQQDMSGAGYFEPLAQLVHETSIGFDAP